MDHYFSGTSNLVLPLKNKTYFPPEFQSGTRLTYYASIFNSIEINASFYQVPLARTLFKWSNEVPEDFRFTFKLFKEVTHSQKQQFDLRPISAFLAAIEAMPNRGCLLVQLPPKFGPDLVQLTMLLSELKGHHWPVAIEFRHPGWYKEQVFHLLSEFNSAMVLHDMRKSMTRMVITAESHVYLRFHGPEAGYRGSYPDEYLSEYAGYIRDWIDEGKTVYCYFNNTLGAAIQNLQTLNRFVG
jgi:uncharacterized protein YecE (DUF72 family)